MALHKIDYLTAMGIQYWHQATPVDSDGTHNLNSLNANIAKCTACDLHKTRKQAIPGKGNLNADLMLISDAPYDHEDQQGIPVAGQPGELLNRMLQAIGLTPNDVYITTLLKCRLPEHCTPITQQIDACAEFLQQQISLIQPKVILVLGEKTAQQLLRSELSLEQLREQSPIYYSQNIPLIPTYHPAHLILNPQDKRKAWTDLQMSSTFLV